jgi:hypothetical protein
LFSGGMNFTSGSGSGFIIFDLSQVFTHCAGLCRAGYAI